MPGVSRLAGIGGIFRALRAESDSAGAWRH
jgi:hypothetical protein